MSLDRTEEQSAIIDHSTSTSDNLMIVSYAGTGKTTTLEMIEREVSTKPILYLCFNKRNADEATKRMLSTTTVRTFNSLGHRVWQSFCNKTLSLNPKKSQDILREIINKTPRSSQGPLWDSYWNVIQGVGMAKAVGYIPEGLYPHAKRLCTQAEFHKGLEETPDDLTSDLIDAVLSASIRASYAASIDYSDQIYMPALFGGSFPRFPLVKVDEYQDLNPTNHAMLDRLVKHRLIGVGDPWQNIYGFRGAKRDGMAEAQAKFKMTPLTLSTSFRCPQAIVEHARWRVPGFQWVKPGGHVERLDKLDGASIPENATILCRNNAPLFAIAFRLLSVGRSVSVAGSDIGPKLIGILRRLGSEDLSRSATLGLIAEWQATREDKGSTTASDLADCMRVFATHGDSLGQAVRYAEHVLAQKGSIRLMTGHKAKGLEFDTVFHLDPWLCGESEQDLNLRYVITTRSKDKLFEVDSRAIQW